MAGADRRLVVTADDFGLTEGVNQGIIEAARAGVVTAVSVIVNIQSREELSRALRLLREAAPQISVGLHFNCLAGRPLTDASSLRARNGAFVRFRTLLLRLITGRLRQSEVAAECAAQIDLLKSQIDVITHIDSHLHVHLLLGFWSTVLESARSRGIQRIRLPLEPLRLNPARIFATAKKILLLVSALFSGAIRYRNCATRFVGISISGENQFAERLFGTLTRLSDGVTELMVHPGQRDEAVLRYTSYINGREGELKALLSGDLRRQLVAEKITLVNFAEIGAQ